MAFLLAVFCDVEVCKEVYSLKNVDVNPHKYDKIKVKSLYTFLN